MKYLDKFKIPFKGLENGVHSFDFKIDKKFFDCFEVDDTEIKSGNLICIVELDKKNNLITLGFDIKGTITTNCDRCLDDYNLEIAHNSKVFVKINGLKEEETDELLILEADDNDIYLSQYIYEFINLELPIRKVHDELETSKTKCNKEMLKKLKEMSIKETENKDEIDPRWEKLKNLNINN